MRRLCVGVLNRTFAFLQDVVVLLAVRPPGVGVDSGHSISAGGRVTSEDVQLPLAITHRSCTLKCSHAQGNLLQHCVNHPRYMNPHH